MKREISGDAALSEKSLLESILKNKLLLNASIRTLQSVQRVLHEVKSKKSGKEEAFRSINAEMSAWETLVMDSGGDWETKPSLKPEKKQPRSYQNTHQIISEDGTKVNVDRFFEFISPKARLPPALKPLSEAKQKRDTQRRLTRDMKVYIEPLVELADRANQLFGSPEETVMWLSLPQTKLRKSPVAMIFDGEVEALRQHIEETIGSRKKITR